MDQTEPDILVLPNSLEENLQALVNNGNSYLNNTKDYKIERSNVIQLLYSQSTGKAHCNEYNNEQSVLSMFYSTLSELEKKCIVSVSLDTSQDATRRVHNFMLNGNNNDSRQLADRLIDGGFGYNGKSFKIRFKQVEDTRKRTLILRGVPYEYIRKGLGNVILDHIVEEQKYELLQTYIQKNPYLKHLPDFSRVYIEFRAPNPEWQLETEQIVLSSGEKISINVQPNESW
eukprot:TRINITY_DN3022_c0_g1_i2.p1 TRINITY_DN3022_c0_g1~~TRINITY_DN3022_c0_g1_i2.p1  ORF type:complete len:230 (-),score=4.65 TRINITY_DN3022_c0_g1_i2:818-1507(-)